MAEKPKNIVAQALLGPQATLPAWKVDPYSQTWAPTGQLLPAQRNIVTGNWRPAVPQSVSGIADALLAPQKALDGGYNRVGIYPGGYVSQVDPKLIDDAATLAGLAQTGSMSIRRPAGSLGSGGFDMTPGGGAKTVKIGQTTIDYGISRDGQTAEIILVKTPPAHRGQGHARTALQSLLSELDRQGVTSFLTAEPMDRGVSKSGLESFYKSLGFRSNSGRAKDFRSRGGMVRSPR